MADIEQDVVTNETDEQENKLKFQREYFMTVCKEHIHREGLDELLAWLDKSDFYTAPASTKNHGAYAGGLCEHCIDVFRYAMKISELYEPDTEHGKPAISKESIAVAALFHDLCKVNFYKPGTRNQKNDATGKWEKVPCFNVEEKFAYGGHGSKSVFLAQWFMRLKQDEAVAINCHMGTWGNEDSRAISDAYKMFPLAWVIHAADEAATFLLDRYGE